MVFKVITVVGDMGSQCRKELFMNVNYIFFRKANREKSLTNADFSEKATKVKAASSFL